MIAINYYDAANVITSKPLPFEIKNHLIIDYIRHCMTLDWFDVSGCEYSQLTQINVRKLSMRESLFVALKFVALRSLNAYRQLEAITLAFEAVSSDEEAYEYDEKFEYDHNFYAGVQKRLKDLRMRGNFDEDTQRLKIQN